MWAKTLKINFFKVIRTFIILFPFFDYPHLKNIHSYILDFFLMPLFFTLGRFAQGQMYFWMLPWSPKYV